MMIVSVVMVDVDEAFDVVWFQLCLLRIINALQYLSWSSIYWSKSNKYFDFCCGFFRDTTWNLLFKRY